ncbi:MAG: sigma-70 family RNA polymerase sigma factor, partial [Acidobacteria bacterium]
MGPSLSAARREASLSSCDCEPALEKAVVELYRNHFEGLFRFAMTITRDRALAEDAIQDSFLRYFVACREGQVIRSPVPWLYRVLRNRL